MATDSDVITLPVSGRRAQVVSGGPIDPISDLPVFINFEHHQVHEGETYQYVNPPAALTSATNLDLLFVVGDQADITRAPHLLIEADATAETWVYLYETPTTSANGTEKTAYNRKRGSLNVPVSKVYLTPTVSAVGTLLSAYILGTGNKTGGASRESAEWDLTKNTNYLIRLASKSSGNTVCVRLNWYEDLGV